MKGPAFGSNVLRRCLKSQLKLAEVLKVFLAKGKMSALEPPTIINENTSFESYKQDLEGCSKLTSLDKKL